MKLWLRYLEFVGQNSDFPLMLCYSADPTPLKPAVRLSASKPVASHKPLRHGRALTELYMQVCLAKAMTSDTGSKSCLYVRDPLPLSAGKKVGNLLTATLAFSPHPKDLGHQGIRIVATSFDRGMLAPMEKILFASDHDMLLKKRSSPPCVADSLKENLTWRISLPCALHDCHNALKWALFGASSSPEVCKDLHIIFESLRNGFDILHAGLPRFVQLSLHFASPWPSQQRSSWRQLWTSLKLKLWQIEELLRLQLRWSDSEKLLHVSVSLKRMKTSQTSYPPSCFPFSSSQLSPCRVGSAEIRKTCVLAALGSSVADAGAVLLLHDDRVPLCKTSWNR